MNVLGDITSIISYGNDNGDPDLKSIAVPGSLAPVLWRLVRIKALFHETDKY